MSNKQEDKQDNLPVPSSRLIQLQSQHNLTLPDWVTPDVLEKLEVLRDFSLEVRV